jgi:hypothetical protein
LPCYILFFFPLAFEFNIGLCGHEVPNHRRDCSFVSLQCELGSWLGIAAQRHIAAVMWGKIFQPLIEDSPTYSNKQLTCITELILSKTKCSLTDAKCICPNAQLNEDITVCVATSCSIRDQLATKKFSSDFCGVVPQDRTKLVSVVGVTFGALALITFGLRILSKCLRAGGQFGMDDYTIMVTMVYIPL